MKIDRTALLLNTLGSFLATVLGIALTFGISKLADMRNQRELQKQCVYNALNDINNVVLYLKADSLYCSGWYPMLPNYIERHANKEKVPADTVAALFTYYFQMPVIFASRYNPVGKPIIETIPPTNAYDMQLHRYISIAYAREAQVIAFEDEYYKFYDRVRGLKQEIECSTKSYTLEEVAEVCLSDKEIQRFARILKYTYENDMFSYYIKELEFQKQRILQYSGISEEEYQKFTDELSQKANVESKD